MPSRGIQAGAHERGGRERSFLLVMDSFEHVLEAAPEVAGL
jgi:hypothetical protein